MRPYYCIVMVCSQNFYLRSGDTAGVVTLDVSRLFRELKVRDKVLPNRIVMPLMVAVRGLTTPQGVSHLRCS